MINWQKVEYDFDFHKQEFPCNVSTVILSEGKSLLPVWSYIFNFYCYIIKLQISLNLNVACNIHVCALAKKALALMFLTHFVQDEITSNTNTQEDVCIYNTGN